MFFFPFLTFRCALTIHWNLGVVFLEHAAPFTISPWVPLKQSRKGAVMQHGGPSGDAGSTGRGSDREGWLPGI